MLDIPCGDGIVLPQSLDQAFYLHSAGAQDGGDTVRSVSRHIPSGMTGGSKEQRGQQNASISRIAGRISYTDGDASSVMTKMESYPSRLAVVCNSVYFSFSGCAEP